jgi:O-antigen ligase
MLGMFMAQSRGEVVAFFGALGVAGLVGYRHKLSRITLILCLLIVGGVSFWFAITSTDVLPERAKARFQEPLDTSAQARLYIWERGLEVAAERPILGQGFQVFGYVTATGRDAHNIYIMTVTELGALGLLLWLAVMLFFCVRALQVHRGWAQMCAVAFVTHVAFRGLTMNVLTSKTTWYQFAVVVALGSLYPASHRAAAHAQLA